MNRIPKASDKTSSKPTNPTKQTPFFVAEKTVTNATATFERLSPSNASIKRAQSNKSAESFERAEQKKTEKSERKSSPQYGSANVSMRPVTATAMTRLGRATSISAHRFANWKAYRKSNE